MCTTEHALTSIQLLDEAERDWLCLVRLQCMGYEHNRADFLDRAISHAESVYGADSGPEIVSRITALIRAMRVERCGGFGYLSPFCANCRSKVTADEWELVVLMRAGHSGGRGEVDSAAADFARRTEAPVLAAAAQRFGSTVAATCTSCRPIAASRAALH